jgi:serine/threonine protein kinase
MSDAGTTIRSEIPGRLSRSGVGRISAAGARLLGSMSAVRASGRFLRKQLWAWPIVAALVLGGAGFWVHHAVENAMREQRATDLNTMVNASVSAVRVWVKEQKINVELFAEDEALRGLVAEIVPLADGSADVERKLVQAKSQEAVRSRLKKNLRLSGYFGYFIVSPAGIVLASDQELAIGKALTGYRKEVFERGASGRTLVTKPFLSPLLLDDENGELRANLPTMFAIGPVRDARGAPVAALGLRIRPEDNFTRILQVVRFGESGETYAFDKSGLLLSQSRFDDELKQIGLLVDQSDARSILTVEIRDPQVNMDRGERPKLRRSEQPLTRLAADAVQEKDGYDADGYRDYRGVPSVGAWRWLPELDIGIATELDTAEAFRPVYILRRAFWSLMGLLAVSAIGIFLAMLFISRQQKALQTATLAAKQLGQYALEEKIGAGGMGSVYKARHAMLRRPTAVKLLDVDKMSDAAILRFEREVQLTSALTHPNTVAVFDYGRTPDGIFYYAMEYLEGMTLEDLVKGFGPLPEARLRYILHQVCGSLAEAHAAGLVHRDIKPANIFLTCRGGMRDFVKVLDFGLAKALGAETANVTSPSALLGTPLYMSPEAMTHPEAVDARADVYAVGAVGYYLLTGSPVFTGATIMEICMKHSNDAPVPPSVRSGYHISQTLEALLLRCLAKAPADRPADAAELMRELEACEVEGSWSGYDAEAWWMTRDNRQISAGQAKPPTVYCSLTSTETPATTVEYPNGARKIVP